MKKLIIFCIILFISSIAYSNERERFLVDNLEKKTSDLWSIELGGFYSQGIGITDSFNINGHIDLTYDNNITAVNVSYEGSFEKLNDSVVSHSSYGELRYDYFFHPRWEFFIFTNHKYDRIENLYYRTNNGIGIKFVIFKTDWIRHDVSLAPLYEAQKYKSYNFEHNGRFSLRYRLIFDLFTDKLEFGTVAFFLPKIYDFTDYRLTDDTYIQVKIFAENKNGIYVRGGYLFEYNSIKINDLEKINHKIYFEFLYRYI